MSESIAKNQHDYDIFEAGFQTGFELAVNTSKDIAKFQKLLEFVKELAKKSCCNVCECQACEAVKVLREIGEEK